MNKVTAFVEIGIGGTYSVYVDLEDKTLNYGIHGNGNTAKEAIDDFISAYETMKKFHNKEGKHFVEAVFEFHFDVPSFLGYYTNYFSLAGLARLTGINQRQLSHYLNGVRSPSKQTIKKIDSSINTFAKNLSQVQFV